MPAVLVRHLPIVVLLAMVGGGIFLIADAFRDRAQLRLALAAKDRALRVAEAEIARAAEVASIHRAHLARAADEAREWDALSNELQQMEGRNAPLSPLLSATADRMYRAGQ